MSKSNPEVIQGQKPSPGTREWLEYFNDMIRKTPDRLEDAAKFLASMISISLAILLAFFKTGSAPPPTSNGFIKISLVCWLLSLVLAFFVLFPFRYNCLSISTDQIKKKHKLIIRNKRYLLMAAASMFVLALLLLALPFLF